MEALSAWISGESSTERNGAWPLVERATNEYLVGPDWGANLEVCDFGNASAAHGAAVCDSLERRLKSKKPREVSLTLDLIQVCAKNGNENLLSAMGGPGTSLMSSTSKLCAKNTLFRKTNEMLQIEQQALSLIQDLGQEFRHRADQFPAFYRTYAQLVQQGVIFPVGDVEQELKPSKNAKSAKPRPSGPRTIRPEEMEKLEHDLMMLSCKIDVTDHLLADEEIGLDSEEILDSHDFLVQCKPRMIELIEASARGLLTDAFLAEALAVNDRLCSVIDRLEGKGPRFVPPAPKVETIGATEVPKLGAPPLSSAPKPSSPSSSSVSSHAKPVADLLGDPFLLDTPTPMQLQKPPPEPKEKQLSRDDEDEEDFDPFGEQQSFIPKTSSRIPESEEQENLLS